MLWSIEKNAVNSKDFGSPYAAACLLSVILLGFFVLSMLSIYSATIVDDGTHYFKMQAFWIAISCILCGIIAFLPLDYIYKNARLLLVIACVPLVYLMLASLANRIDHSLLKLFPFTKEIKGAVRWLTFGPVSIQPSEFAKLFLLVFLASYYGVTSREKVNEFVRGILVPGTVCATVLAFIFLGKDLSTSFVTAAMCGTMIYLAGARFRYLVLIIATCAVLVTLAIVSSPNRMNRIKALEDPELYRLTESYQLYRSQLCIGSGGATGTGYSQGIMKTYLPEQHTDFIVSVIGEEFGFIGCSCVIAGYLLITFLLFNISRQCRDRRDMLVCLGCATLIASQSFVNIGVVSGCLPPTGVTAPFLSYGGSSMLSLMCCIGIVFNIVRRNGIAIQNEMQKLKFSSMAMH